jgi:hypothetical protein
MTDETRDWSSVPTRGFPSLPGLVSTSVPPEFGTHPLVVGRHFFTIPRVLLEEIEHSTGTSPLGDLRRLELELSGICEGHWSIVGFRNGNPISYRDLEPAPSFPKISKEIAAKWGMNDSQVGGLRRAVDKRLGGIARTMRGYVGWLVTNSTFLGNRTNCSLLGLKRSRIGALPESGESS